MPIDLNLTGESYAHSLIAAGKVDKTSAWSFDDATDGSALLGKSGDDWESYGKHHLGLDRSAKEKTKGRFRYPFAKGDKLYRSGIIAIKQRAAQQNDAAIERAAGALLTQIDKVKTSPDFAGNEFKGAPFEFKFLDSAAAGTFEGHVGVFNNRDDGGDVIVSGAFDDALAQHKAQGTMPVMLLNHGGLPFSPPTAESLIPIGVWHTMSPDSRGLQSKGQLINLDTESGKRIHGAMRDKAITGLSMMYRARAFVRGVKASEPKRTLQKVDLFEAGPVTFPLNRLATISSVKSSGRINSIREFENFLRDEGGFSHAVARAIAERGFKSSEPRDEDGAISDLLATLKSVRAGLPQFSS
jgi:HK97 family phage prohead protease